MVDEVQGKGNLIVFGSSSMPESNGSSSDMDQLQMPRTCNNDQREDQTWSDRSSTCPILLHDPGSSDLRDIFAGLGDDSNSNNVRSASSLVLPDLTATTTTSSADADQLAAISTNAISMPSAPSASYYNLLQAGADSAVTTSAANIASPAPVAATLLRSAGSDSMPDSINTATTAWNASTTTTTTTTVAATHGVLQKRRAGAGLLNLGDRVHALQQLVSPFGKTDTASVLLEAIGYIKFLQDQVQVLSSPYMKSKAGSIRQQIGQEQSSASDLRSRGLCLVPVSCTLRLASSNMNIGADYWASSNHQDAIRHSLQRSDRERDAKDQRSASGGLDR